MKGLMDFVKKNGIAGLAAGFAVGTAFYNLMQNFTVGVLEPLLSRLFGNSLVQSSSVMGEGADAVVVHWGQTLTLLINLAVVVVFIWVFLYFLGFFKKK